MDRSLLLCHQMDASLLADHRPTCRRARIIRWSPAADSARPNGSSTFSAVYRQGTVKPSTPLRELLAAVLVAVALPASAQSVFVDVGRGGIGDYFVVSRSNDRSSVCDEYINPNALGVPGCTTADRGVGDGWSAPFSGGVGLVAGAGVEFDIAGPWKLAVDYSRGHAVFDQTVASTNAQGVDFEKLSNELDVGQESLGALTTNGVHGILELYPLRRGRIRPYGGIGLGYAAMRADLGWNWRRTADPQAITTGRDQPNFDEIRTNLAGTVSRVPRC